jgi:hypothetical protein
MKSLKIAFGSGGKRAVSNLVLITVLFILAVEIVGAGILIFYAYSGYVYSKQGHITLIGLGCDSVVAVSSSSLKATK